MADHDVMPRDPRASSKVFAIAATLLLLAGSSIIAAQVAPLIGVPTREDRNALLFGDGPPQWLAAAEAETMWLILRFGLTLLVAWAICAWRRGPTRREASLSLGGRSAPELIGLGLGVCIVMQAPLHALWTVHLVYPLGQNTEMWALFQRSEWSWEFWLFTAASSFALVPIVEELFFRGYMLGRLRENFSVGGAVLLCAVLFWVSHGQYLSTDPFLLAHSVSTLIGATVLGWITLRTGSLVPALTAHVAFNIPGNIIFHAAWIVAALAILLFWRRSAWRLLVDYARLIASTREWLFLIGAGAVVLGIVLLLRAEPRALYPAIGVFALLALASLTRRRKPKERLLATSV